MCAMTFGTEGHASHVILTRLSRGSTRVPEDAKLLKSCRNEPGSGNGLGFCLLSSTVYEVFFFSVFFGRH